MCGLLFKLSFSSFIVFNMNQTCLPVNGLELKVGPKIFLHFICDPHPLFSYLKKSYVCLCFVFFVGQEQ